MRQYFPGLSAESSWLLNTNPDRGFRLEMAVQVRQLVEAGDYAARKAKAAEIINNAKNGGEQVTLAQTYFYLNGYREEDLPDAAFEAMDVFLETLSEKGVKALLRFAYARDMLDPNTDVTQGWMLRHMMQLADFLKRHHEQIHAFQAGFVGAWGEWHSFFYPLDRPLLMGVIVDHMLPPNMYLQVRQPFHKDMISSENPRYRDIGHHNDACFGKSLLGKGRGTGDIDADTPIWKRIRDEAAFTPQDGELYWSWWNRDNGVYTDGYDMIEQLSEHRFTSLSVLHGYADVDCALDCTMERWKCQPLTEEWLQEHHVLYQPSWFYNADDSHAKRNVFEFVRDYLGYRIELQTVELYRHADSLQVDLSLINYGFSAAFNMESGFALLDEGDNVVSEVAVGDPSTWYNRPIDYETAVSLQHRMSTMLTLPMESGTYHLAFYLRNAQNVYARTANDLPFVNGYTVLCKVELP